MKWTCKYCQQEQISAPANRNYEYGWVGKNVHNIDEQVYRIISLTCLNSECQKIEINFDISRLDINTGGNHAITRFDGDNLVYSKCLVPEGAAKPQGTHIPEAIVQDYEEACKIRDLSPKASATLARRALESIIRDFCGAPKQKNLNGIIKWLRDGVDNNTAPREVLPEVIDAIDAVRKIGNIGAHMEADHDLIVDVDKGEAQHLINLIEMLFKEWYDAREQRKARLAAVTGVQDDKAQDIAKKKAAKAATPTS